MSEVMDERVNGGVGAAIPHDSGHLHVSGEHDGTKVEPKLRRSTSMTSPKCAGRSMRRSA